MRLKKLLSIILLSILLFVTTRSMMSYAAELNMKDVSPESEQYSIIQWVIEQGYMSLTLGKFLPAKYVKRSEFAAIVTKLSGNGKTLQNPKTSTFQDVTSRNQFYKQIETARNYMTSYKVKNSKLFKPDVFITREDAMFSIVKVLGYDTDEAMGSNGNMDLSLEDVLEDADKISPALFKDIAVGISFELMEVRTVGDKLFFDPKINITRGVLAQLIYNAYQKKDYTAEEGVSEDKTAALPAKSETVFSDEFASELNAGQSTVGNQDKTEINLPPNTLRFKSINAENFVMEGIETLFWVVVEYNLDGYDSAIIDIVANDGITDDPYRFYTDNLPNLNLTPGQKYYSKNWNKIYAGKGTISVPVIAKPTKWPDIDFQIHAVLMVGDDWQKMIFRDRRIIEIK